MNIIYEPPPVNSTGLYVNADVGFYCDMFFEPDGPCSFCMKMFVDVSWVDSTNTIPWQSIGANEIVVNCWDFVGPPTDKWEELFETFPICQGKASEIQEKPAIVTITVGAFPKGAGPCPNDPYENHDALYRYAGTEWVDKFFRDFNMEGFWDTW
ncbi:hypothetical protein AB1L88_24275 [Tautonia sp. JC769]|uniref:hypothetical protein n=1 Tax=Tautonia sp. JC769 TaxID=3232135 RepID=UPI0034588E1E